MCLLSVSVLLLASPSIAVAAPAAPSFSKAIEALAGYAPQSTCSPSAKSGALALRSLVTQTYAGTGDSGIVRACAAGGVSEHKEGRAWDWRVNAYDARQDAQAKDFFAWLLADDAYGSGYAMARRLGVMYVIYNRHIWSSYNAAAGWRPYTGSNPHTDHVHISLSWPGADRTVSFWGSSVTTPTPAGPTSPVGLPPVTLPKAPPTTTTSGSATTPESPVTAKWQAMGGATGPLGAPLGAERAVRSGRARDFAGGTVLWSAATGARAVYGMIGQRYAALGGPDSALGLPTTDETGVKGGRASTFQGGQVLWSGPTGAHAVYGDIAKRYTALGGPDSALGLPTTDETGVKGGRANTFQGGQVLWSKPTGAQDVYGDIGKRYAALGGPAGPLGLPTTGEVGVKGGRANTFQGGQVLWSGPTGAHAVYGDIAKRYTALGGPAGPLQLPTTGELDVPGGRANSFQGGRLYWSKPAGAHAVTGAVRDHHDAYGGAAGPLGVPVGDLARVTDAVAQQLFAGGQVYLRAGQARHVRGAIRDRYLALGGPTGRLGLPVSDEYDVPGGRRSDFDTGQLTWNATTKVVSGP